MTATISRIPIRSVRSALLLAYLCMVAPIAAQDTFYAHYAANGPQTGGHITPGLDNGFYGVTSHNMLDRIYCYKIDAQADLVWMKEVTLSGLIVPLAISALSDSTFAFLAVQVGTASTVVVKVEDDGDILWTRTLYNADGGDFHALAPTTDGGMVLTGGGCAGADMILHLDPQGHILSQHGHASWNSVYSRPNARKMIHEGNNQYAYLGHATQPGGTYRPLTFARSDSAGNVYSYREIHFPSGIATTSPWGETLVRSTSGGHYLTTMVDDTAMNHVVLMYLNDQDQLEWFKEIATPHLRMTADALTPTEDGGCVLMGGTVVNIDPYLYHTYAIKFNEQGDLIWSKMFGDIDVPFWDRLSIQNVWPMAGGSFMTVPVRWSHFDFCKLDAAFNGYCYEQPFVPLVSDQDPTVIPYPITPTTIHFVEGSLTPTSVANGFPRTNLCSSYTTIPETRADLALTIAPNPAHGETWLTIPELNGTADVELMDTHGRLLHRSRQTTTTDRLDLRGLAPGMYAVHVHTVSMRYTGRVLVE